MAITPHALHQLSTNHEAEYFCQSQASLFRPITAAALACKKALASNFATTWSLSFKQSSLALRIRAYPLTGTGLFSPATQPPFSHQLSRIQDYRLSASRHISATGKRCPQPSQAHFIACNTNTGQHIIAAHAGSTAGNELSFKRSDGLHCLSRFNHPQLFTWANAAPTHRPTASLLTHEWLGHLLPATSRVITAHQHSPIFGLHALVLAHPESASSTSSSQLCRYMSTSHSATSKSSRSSKPLSTAAINTLHTISVRPFSGPHIS